MDLVAQQYILALKPYEAGLPIDVVARKYGLDPANVIKLASNENPLGMSTKARDAVDRAILREGHMYPDQYNLTQKLSAKLGVEPANIILGNGSNDILDLIARTFIGEGREGVSSRYGFAAYQIATQAAGGTNVVVADKDFGNDLDAILKAITPNTGVVFIANPNNPTGTLLDAKELEDFIGKVPAKTLVVLDEAYYEYLEDGDKPDSINWVKKYPNLLVTRTFSKVYGLAGMRIGYAVASPEIIDVLNRVRLPFNVNSLGLVAATAALDDDAFVERSVELNRSGRALLKEGFARLEIEHLPMHGNFVLFKIDNASIVKEELLKRGVILRGVVPYGLTDFLRVTIGTTLENTRFLESLHDVLKR